MPASEASNPKDRMLEVLDEIRRKVTTGEVDGIVMLARTHERTVLSRCVGETMPPHGVLILQEIAKEAREIWLERYDLPDDGRPLFRAVRDDEHDEHDEDDEDDDESGGDDGNGRDHAS